MTTVDPALEAIIKHANAPVTGAPRVLISPTIPGERGIVNGIRCLFGIVRNGIDFVTSQREAYGDIYQAQFLLNHQLMVWDADLIHEILQNNERAWSTALGWHAVVFEGLEPRGNVGVLSSLDFEDHRAARKLLQRAFTMKAIHGYMAVARRAFDETLPRWVAAGRVDFKAEVRSLINLVANEIFTGLTDPNACEHVDALVDFWKGTMALSRNSWLSPTHRRSRRGLQTLIKTFLALVPQRRRNPGPDFFSHMCQEVNEDGTDDETMVRVFVSILFGAFDTTSLSLCSMGYLLAKHPEWQARLREEVIQTSADSLDSASMKAMRQTEWAWKETLRLMPSAPYVPRAALRDVELGGYAIKAGTLVMPMTGAIGHHPRWWKNPKRFDPERFSPERAEDKQHPAIFLPFGGGAHACVGMQLANMEVKLFWHQLLRRCSFSLAPDYVARHENSPMGRPSGAVALKLTALSGD